MTVHTPAPGRQVVTRFLRAPIELRSYANLLYLLLAFPLGLLYFIFLSVGLSLGVGLTIIWVGLPVLALVLAGSWGLAALERRLAIGLLGAEVPPVAPPPDPSRTAWRRLRDVLANPVTWKGMGYLALKFPLGLATFVLAVTLIALSVSLLAMPLVVAGAFDGARAQVFAWVIDTPAEALLCLLFGAVFSLVALNLLNGVAAGWQRLASVMLGSPRFAAPAA